MSLFPSNRCGNGFLKGNHGLDYLGDKKPRLPS